MDRAQLTARIAYALFEHRGHAHGRDRDDWIQAERLIAELTGATATEQRAARPPAARPAPDGELAGTALERRALEALARAVAERGRAGAAAALGYASTGAISDVLRGRRALRRDLAERILAAFEAAPEEGVRVLDGGLERRARRSA